MQGEDAIQVWLTSYPELVDECVLSRLRGLLSKAEQRHEQGFRFAEDRKRYLVTRAMVRSLLSRYARVKPADWQFATNVHGRPFISNVHDGPSGLSFNVSHTNGLIAVALSCGRELGVDVERVQPLRGCAMDIAQRFFSPSEVDELAKVPSERQLDRFFEHWTFKESYIKARGLGMAIPLDQFGFDYPDRRTVRIAMKPELGDVVDRWSFWQYRPVPGYLLAICAERRGGHAPRPTLRRLIPAVGEEAMDLEPHRSSGPEPVRSGDDVESAPDGQPRATAPPA